MAAAVSGGDGAGGPPGDPPGGGPPGGGPPGGPPGDGKNGGDGWAPEEDENEYRNNLRTHGAN